MDRGFFMDRRDQAVRKLKIAKQQKKIRKNEKFLTFVR